MVEVDADSVGVEGAALAGLADHPVVLGGASEALLLHGSLRLAGAVGATARWSSKWQRWRCTSWTCTRSSSKW